MFNTRIVIELYDRGPDLSEVEELAQDIRTTLQPSGDVWAVRYRAEPELSPEELSASEKLYAAAQRGEYLHLRPEEAAALWQRVHRDAMAARAIAKP